jgi:hypothetical protein
MLFARKEANNPTKFSRCELSKLSHRSKFGNKGLCPQITQIHADMKHWFEREDAENAECSLCALRAFLFQNSSSASICVNLRAIPNSVAVDRALPLVRPLWDQHNTQVANAQSLATIRIFCNASVKEGKKRE